MIQQGFCDDTNLSKIKRAHILSTDESPVELNSKPIQQNCRTRTSDPTDIPVINVPKFGVKIMVAAGISRYGHTDLHIVPQGQTVNGEYYQNKILPVFKAAMDNKMMFPRQQHNILMQDGAKAHRAKKSMELIKSQLSGVCEDWPGNSPDLNVIENVWAELQNSVFKQPRPSNRVELESRVLEEWENFDQSYFANLIKSHSRCIHDCIDAHGNGTKN